jgi:hypothetical protein
MHCWPVALYLPATQNHIYIYILEFWESSTISGQISKKEKNPVLTASYNLRRYQTWNGILYKQSDQLSHHHRTMLIYLRALDYKTDIEASEGCFDLLKRNPAFRIED